MPKLTINTLLSQAIWDVYNGRCFVCSRLIAYENRQVDHIVPQYLEKEENKVEREKLLESYALPMEFEIHHPDNYMPLCDFCNGKQKRGVHLLPAQAHLWLSKAAESSSKIIETYEKYQRQHNTGKEESRLKKMIWNKTLQPEKVITIAEEYTKEQTIISSDTPSTSIEQNDQQAIKLMNEIQACKDTFDFEIAISKSGELLDLFVLDEKTFSPKVLTTGYTLLAEMKYYEARGTQHSKEEKDIKMKQARDFIKKVKNAQTKQEEGE